MDESRQPVESGGGVWLVAGGTLTHTCPLQLHGSLYFIFHSVVLMEDFDELGLLVMVFVLSGQYLTYTARISVPLWCHILTRPWPAADCGQTGRNLRWRW